MSVWDVPGTDQLPAGCSPALLHGMGAPAGRGLMLPHHGDHFGMRDLPHPAVPCTQQDHTLRPFMVRQAARQQVRFRFTS